MRRIALWLASTTTAVVLLFGYHTSTSGPDAAGNAPAPIVGSVSTSTSGTGTTGTGTTGTDKTVGHSTTTTVTGDAADTRYGPVQVSLTVQGGSIVSVEVPEYPSGDGRDLEINSYALPILVQETLDAQSASIDMVSGATFTSQGYEQSLQSALDQAGV